MKASSERISSICSSLGHDTPSGYVPSDDCQINLNELAFSIWHDDENSRDVCRQVFELDVYKRDFIPLLLIGEPISYIALKALTAVTYMPSNNADEYEKHVEILKKYKYETSFHPEIFAKVLEYTASVIENPRAEVNLLNRAELALTFIRNIAIIPSPPDVHEKITKIFVDSLLFEVIDSLKLIRFGDRAKKFARLIMGILYGVFVPYLPFKKSSLNEKSNEPQKSDILRSFLNSKKSMIHTSSRHGHWGGSVTVKGTGKGYTLPINLSLKGETPLPPGKHLRIKQRPIDVLKQVPIFSKDAEIAAAKVVSSSIFPLIFELAVPKAFIAYNKCCSAYEQLQFCEVSRFFMDYSLQYGAELKVNPLASKNLITFFQTTAMFWIESTKLEMDGVTSIQVTNVMCRLYYSLSSYLLGIINNSGPSEVSNASTIISKYTSDIENYLIEYLSQNNLSKKTINMLKDCILALDALQTLYNAAQDNDMIKISTKYKDEDVNPNEDDRIYEDLNLFTSDMIVKRIIRKKNAIKPYFILLQNINILDDKVIIALTRVFKQFLAKKNGLAHLFRIWHFYIINKIWSENLITIDSSDAMRDLNEVLEEIVSSFFKVAMKDKNCFVLLLSGFEPYDLKTNETDEIVFEDDNVLELSNNVRGLLDKMKNIIKGNNDNNNNETITTNNNNESITTNNDTSNNNETTTTNNDTSNNNETTTTNNDTNNNNESTTTNNDTNNNNESTTTNNDTNNNIESTTTNNKNIETTNNNETNNNNETTTTNNIETTTNNDTNNNEKLSINDEKNTDNKEKSIQDVKEEELDSELEDDD